MPPMSLHLGPIRIGIGNVPILDVVCDTTESRVRALGSIAFSALAAEIANKIFNDRDGDPTRLLDSGPLTAYVEA